MTPKDRSGSRRSPDNSQFTVVCHKDFLAEVRKKCEEDGVALAEVVRNFLAEWVDYDKDRPLVAGRKDRV